MKYLCTIFLLTAAHIAVTAKTWYVTGKGSDSNDGTSQNRAFQSLQKAETQIEPGDIVLIGNGIYTNSNKASGSAVLTITKSGKPNAWITWKAITGEHPVLRPVGWTGILISGSYHIIDGLTIIGNNDEIVLLNAQEQAKNPVADGAYNTNGIFINGRIKKADEKPHHIIIRNCEIGKCPGGGIAAIETDYVTIEDCKVYQNAWYMRYGGSGISFLTNWAHDDAPGYHNIVQRNYVWDNKTLVFWEKIGKLSDGNGIIMDATNQENEGASNPNGDAELNPSGEQSGSAKSAEPAKSVRPVWKGRTLIANNLSAYNGGSGIHTFRTKHVDIVNNTTYCNGQTVGYQEIFANNSADITILNNIMVPRPGGKVTSNNKNTNIIWDFNLYPEVQHIFKGANDIVANPGFIDIELNPLKGNFRLSKNSPGINSGTSELLQPTDITGKKRPAGNHTDIGAFEQ